MIAITDSVKALAIVGARVPDHLVIGGREHVSKEAKGLMDPERPPSPSTSKPPRAKQSNAVVPNAVGRT